MTKHHSLMGKKVPAIHSCAKRIVEAATASGITAEYPSGPIIAGDLLLALFGSRSSSNTAIIPAGWTDLHSDVDTGNFWRQRTFFKIADGTETPGGTFGISLSGVNTTQVRAVNVYLIKGATRISPIWDVTQFVSSSVNIAGANLTPTTPAGLAMMLFSHVGNYETNVITGNSGGVWKRPFTYSGMTGPISTFSLTLNMQCAELYNPSIISGGSSPLANLFQTRNYVIKSR